MSWKSRLMQRSLHRDRAMFIVSSNKVDLKKLRKSNAYLLCTYFARISPNPLPDVSRLVDEMGYLVLETPHAMQMKPSISKHAISLMIPRFMRPLFE